MKFEIQYDTAPSDYFFIIGDVVSRFPPNSHVDIVNATNNAVSVSFEVLNSIFNAGSTQVFVDGPVVDASGPIVGPSAIAVVGTYALKFSNSAVPPKLVSPYNRDATTSLSLPGRGYLDYGELINQNLLNMLENFASDVAPTNPIIGQNWFDITTNTMRTYQDDGGAGIWVGYDTIYSGTSQPVNPLIGQLWYDNSVGPNRPQLMVYDGSNWIGTSSHCVLKTGDTVSGKLHITAGGLQVDNDLVTLSNSTINQTSGNYNISGGVINLSNSASIVLDSGSVITLGQDPVNGMDATTKQYVDSVSQGLKVKPPVRAATTGAITAVYDNGTLGDGASLTIPATVTFDVDGVVNWVVNDTILVKDQSLSVENGHYLVSQVGDIATDWILTRCESSNASNEIPASFVFVQEGDVYASTGWVSVTGIGLGSDVNEFELGSDTIDFFMFSKVGDTVAGLGLDKVGVAFNVKTGAGITDLPAGFVGVDVHPDGGIMTSIDGQISSTDESSQVSIKLDGNSLSCSSTGLKLNSAFADLEYVKRTGSSMIGVLILNADPTTNLGAATKQYVDTKVATKQSLLGYSAVNRAGDTMTGQLVLNGYPLVPNAAASKKYVDDKIALNSLGYTSVNAAGDTMTGDLILNANPTVALGAATKQYVDAANTLLLNHTSNTNLHLTSTQNTWIDSITPSSTEINYMFGATSNIQNQLNTKISTIGATMTGALTLHGNPTSALHAVTKQYVDSITGGTSEQMVFIGTTSFSLDRVSGAQTLNGLSIGGNAATATTAGAVVTTNNYQMRSLGVGTTPSATAGEIRATNEITAFFSDGRLKTVKGNIPDALNKVLSLNGVVYTNNQLAIESGFLSSDEHVGVIAQEVEKVLPQVIRPAPFDFDIVNGQWASISGQHYKTVQYDKMVPLLIEAIKEQQTQINELREQLRVLIEPVQ
jgi:hypothetical protein